MKIRSFHKQVRARVYVCVCVYKVIYPCALTEHHAMKACWGSGGIAPRIL
jgi:hypothetical protein